MKTRKCLVYLLFHLVCRSSNSLIFRITATNKAILNPSIRSDRNAPTIDKESPIKNSPVPAAPKAIKATRKPTKNNKLETKKSVGIYLFRRFILSSNS